MKAVAKKADASHKRELYRTGGGRMPKDAAISDLDQQVLDILVDSIDPVPNSFDDDASFHGDKADDEHEPDKIVDVTNLRQSTSTTVNDTEDACPGQSTSQPVISQSTVSYTHLTLPTILLV